MKSISSVERFVKSPEQERLLAEELLLLEASDYLFEIMEKRKIKKAELAERLGKSKAFITQVINGRRNMTLRTLSNLAWALGHQVKLNLPSCYDWAEFGHEHGYEIRNMLVSKPLRFSSGRLVRSSAVGTEEDAKIIHLSGVAA